MNPTEAQPLQPLDIAKGMTNHKINAEKTRCDDPFPKCLIGLFRSNIFSRNVTIPEQPALMRYDNDRQA